MVSRVAGEACGAATFIATLSALGCATAGLVVTRLLFDSATGTTAGAALGTVAEKRGSCAGIDDCAAAGTEDLING
jgi:hypothetical protein